MKNILIDVIDVDANRDKLDYLKRLPGISVELVDFSLENRYRLFTDGKGNLPKERIHDKHILFCSAPPSNIEDMESLEFIQISSAGYAQLFGLGLVEKGIRAANAQGVSDVPIAEWCMSMMVNLARDLKGMIRNQNARVWDCDSKYQRQIRGSIVGIWGYGSIGRETARLAKSLGMKVYVLARQIRRRSDMPDVYSVEGTGDPDGTLPDMVFSPGQEAVFLKNLDFLVMAMPMTKNTRGIVGEKELHALPQKAFVLNPARGALIEEDALLESLREGWISGAAIDTHYHYPMPADHPLWGFPNVIMTPHISGTCLMGPIWDIFITNVERLLAGKPLLNELSTAKLRGE